MMHRSDAAAQRQFQFASVALSFGSLAMFAVADWMASGGPMQQNQSVFDDRMLAVLALAVVGLAWSAPLTVIAGNVLCCAVFLPITPHPSARPSL